MTVRHAQDQDDFAAEPNSLDLRQYWLIVRRRWRLVVVVAVLGAACGVEYSAHAGHTYTAQASVVVDAVTQGPQGGTTPVTTPVNMSTEQAIAQSAAVIQLAAAKLGMPVAQLDAATAKRLSVSVPTSALSSSNVLQVDWQAAKPALAQQDANAFAAAYLAYRQHVLQGEVTVLQKNLQQQAITLKKEIKTLSGQLSGTVAGSSANQVLTVQLTQVSQQYNTTLTELAAIPAYNASGGQLIPALLPSKASGLSRSVLGAGGLILGLLIGLMLAFARDLFDDRLHDSGQLEQRLGAVTLAVLPSPGSRVAIHPIRTRAKPGPPPVIAITAAPESAAAEATRTMRAAVIAVSSRRKLRVVLLVGADASVSSSQVAAELGVALAESDRRVLLVASDLRGSALPSIFQVPGRAGLSELLLNGGDAETVIHWPRQASGSPLPDEITRRLEVLPSGQSTRFAVSALDSGRMRDLLDSQRESHDFVLLDAPPATAADVLSLAMMIDGVIVLVREKKTAAKDIDALRHRLEQVSVPIVGGVLISRRHGRGRPRAARRRTTTSQPVLERPQLSAPDRADKTQTAANATGGPVPAGPDDTISLPAAGEPLKQPR